MGFFKDFKQDLSEAVKELSDEAVGSAVSEEQYEVESEEPAVTVADDEVVDTLTDMDSDVSFMEALAALDTESTTTEQAKEPEAPAVAAKDIQEEVAPVATEPAVTEPEVEAVPAEDTKAVDETAIITTGLKITGDIESTGSIEFLGTIVGNVTCRGKLVASGTIVGNTQSAEFFSDHAKITGDICCDGPAKIGNETVIKGNLNATSAVIAGAIKGDVDVHGPVIIDTTAIVIGDIKSKSVQINNGAVIDGRVSQCYADLKPVTIFGED